MSKQEAKEFFALYSKEVQELAWQARDLIFSLAPDISETVYPQMKVIRYGTDGNKMSGLVFGLMPTKNGVSLGFMHGASLPDPENLLEGTGKNLRHVKLKSVEDVARPALRNLLDAELAAAAKS
jgi:hypothetical protein